MSLSTVIVYSSGSQGQALSHTTHISKKNWGQTLQLTLPRRKKIYCIGPLRPFSKLNLTKRKQKKSDLNLPFLWGVTKMSVFSGKPESGKRSILQFLILRGSIRRWLSDAHDFQDWLVRLGEVGIDQVRLSQARLGKVRLGQVRFGQVKLGQVRLGQVRSGQVRLGQVRLGQVRLGQVRLRLVG